MKKSKKLVSIALITAMFSLTLVGCEDSEENLSTEDIGLTPDIETTTEETSPIENSNTGIKYNETEVNEDNEAENQEEAGNENSGETESQKQAIKMAQSYLDYKGFSREKLIGQLEYGGFNNEDATYAVDKLNVDWKEQAVKVAQSFLDYKAFSREGLIDQLEYGGFSNEDAVYGVDATGL